MLESIVAGILSKYLGDYIVGLEGENLSLNITGGHVVLENLQIKKECLAELELPITVKEGFLGKFSLEIPWSSLGSKPAVAIIERVYLVAGPTNPADYNINLVKKKQIETKKRKLQVNELLAADPTKEEKQPIIEGEEKLSYSQKLIRTVVDNFQVFVKKVHFRYEDDISQPGRKFAIGATIESFQAESCDADWTPKFLKNETRQFVHKLANLKNFAVYWSSDCDFVDTRSVKALGKAMENLIFQDGKKIDSSLLQDYLLHPINGELKIQLNQHQHDFHVPKLIAQLAFDSVIGQLKERQFHDLIYMGNYFTYYIRGVKYHEFRPDRRIKPAKEPLKWWAFGVKSVLKEVREKRAQKTWKRLSKYKRDRLLYITLYKKKLIQKKKTAEIVIDTLTSMENALDYDDIILFRALTDAWIRKELREKRLHVEKQGWFGGWFHKKDEDIHTMEEISFNDWRDLYKDINFLDEPVEDVVPPDYIKMKASFSVGEGSFELIGDLNDREGDLEGVGECKIIQAGFEGFHVDVEQRPKGESVRASLLSVAVVDHFTLSKEKDSVEMVSLNDSQISQSTHFFKIEFDRNPLDSSADMRLHLAALQSLNITFGMEIINRITKFFHHEANVNQLKLAANSTWDSLKESAEVQVKYALDKRKVIELSVDVVAPNVMIPAGFTDPNASMLVIELGTLSMRSDNNNRTNSIIRSGKDVQQVNKEFYYDKFQVKISSIHVLIADRSYTPNSKLNPIDIDLVQKFDINLDLFLCTVTSSDLPKLRLSGRLPKLMALISPTKIGRLFSILRSLSGASNADNSNIKLIEENPQEFNYKEFSDEKAKAAKAQKIDSESKMDNLLQVDFTFSDLLLEVHRDVALNQYDDRQLLLLQIHQLRVKFSKTSYDLTAHLTLRSLHILDFIQQHSDQLYLVQSKGSADSDDLVSIKYIGIPKTSPKFDKIEHSFDIHFNTLEVQVNRETIASLLTFSNSILDKMKDPAQDDALVASPQPEKQSDKLTITQLDDLHVDSILVHAHIQIGGLKATLLKGGLPFVVSSLTNSVVRTHLHSNNEMKLSGHLGNIAVYDYSKDTLWEQIVVNTGENRILEFWFETVNPDVKNDSLAKVILTLQISSVRFIFLSKFLKSLSSYLTELSEMQMILSKTAKKAKEKAEDVKASSLNKLVIFDISVANPQVVIPLKSNDNSSYIVANLGDISITNKFEKGDSGVMLDMIGLKISDISMYSMHRDKNPKKRDIIENTDIFLSVYRAAFWNDNHLFPDITANVKIRKIALKLCELQLQLLVGILGGNLAELPDQSADLEKFKDRLPASKDDDQKRLEISDSTLLLDFIKYKFSLELGQTSLEILEGEGASADGSESSLVKLSIDDLSTLGSISESSKFQTKLLIRSISISDTRPKIDNHFKKLLTTYKKEDPNLIKLKFVKEPTGNQNAVIIVNSPRILLIPDLLLKFKDVAMHNLDYFNKSMEEMKKNNGEIEKKIEEDKVEEEESKGDKSNPTGLFAKVTIIDPQVCLIENIKEHDSRLLVLKQSLEVDFTMNSSGVQYSKVDITSIQLYKCRMESENPISILTPFNMKINYELMPKEIMSILIDFDLIDLKISYSDFKLLMIIKNNWLEALPKTETKEIESNEVVDKFKLKKREPKKEIVLHEEVEKKKGDQILSETLRITFNKIKLLLLNDCYEEATNTPLLDLALDQMDAQINNWSTEIRGKFNLISMKAFYYNSSENTNEPMIEPWDFNGNFFKGENGCFNAELIAPDILNMNITKSFIESLLNNLEQWQLDFYDKATSERPILHPYYIVNQTGLPLTYWITGTQKRISIESGVELPLDISELHSNRDQVDQEFMISLQLEADDLIPVHNLPVFKKTTMIFDLTLKNNIKLLYTIEFRHGSRVLIFGSDFSFVNSTNSPLDVLIEHKNLPPLSFDCLEPSQKRYVPLRYANQSTIRFKPSDRPFKWSMEVINSSNLKREAVPMLITCPSELHSSPNWLYSVDIKGEREQKGKLSNEGKEIIFSLFAPLKLENTLPEKLNFQVKGGSNEELANGHLEAGESIEIFHVQKDSRPKLFLNLNGYLWSAMNKIGATSVMTCQIESKAKRVLSLGIDVVTTPFGARSATVFVKYWLYNQTGDKLKYKNVQLLNLNNNKSIAGDSEIVTKSIPTSVSNFNISDSDSSLISSSYLSSSDQPLFDLAQPDLRCIKPFIFSGDVLSLRNNSTAWSTSVSLKSNGGVIEAQNLNDRKMADPLRSQQFSVLIQSAPGRYYRTSIVKITPHYIFINKTNFPLEVRQKDCAKSPLLIYQNDQTLFNWHRKDLEKFLQFTFEGDEFDWSSPFSIDSANNFQVPIWKKADSTHPLYVRITINITGTSVTVIFLCSDDDFPDYRIENYSSHSLTVSEFGESTSYRIDSERFIPFAWKSPLSPKKQIVITIPRTTIEAHVSLDKLHLYPYLAWPNINGQFQYLSVEVIADGPTKVLQIDDLSPDDVPEYDQKLFLADINRQSDRKLELKQEEYSNKEDIKALFNIVMKFNEIGFSLIDEKPQELLYLNLRVMKLFFCLLDGTQSLELSVENMQIDNQLYHTQYPIFFYSAPVEGQPFFQLSLLRSEKYPNILYFPYFGVKFQKFDVQLDEIFLLRVLNFAEILTKFLASRKVEEEEAELFRTSPSYHLTSNSSQIQSNMLYFDILHINPLMMTITFSAVGGRDQETSGGMLEKTLRAGGFLASIDNAPLRLNGLILENPFISQSQLISRIIQHYTQQGLREFYLLLGSADVLGNPVSLVSNLGTGVYDFFHEPAEGIVSSPQDFAFGVARGTKSLVKNSVFGVFNSASKISGTISKAAATISLDDDWQRSRAKKMSNKPQHLGQGLRKGVKDLGTGVFEGVTGVVSQPLRGFNKEGGIGLVKGVGKGVTGLVLRPVVGVVDFITDTTEGIKNSAVYFDEKKHRIRPPRFIGPDHIVGLYDPEKSWGQFILRTIDNASYDSQFLVDIIELVEEKFLIISDKIVLVLLIKGKNSINRRARFSINEISGVERGEEGVILDLTTAEKSLLLECNPPNVPAVIDSLRKLITKAPAKANVMAEYHRLEDPKMIAKFSKPKLDQSGSNNNIIINEIAKAEEEEEEDKKSNEKSPLVSPRASVNQNNKNANANNARKNTEKQPLLRQPPRNPNQPPRKRPQDDECCCCCIS